MKDWIISYSVLIIIITAMRFICRGKIKAIIQYALWAIVLVRLLLPVSFGTTGFSILKYVPSSVEITQTIENIIAAPELAVAEKSDPVYGQIQEFEAPPEKTTSTVKILNSIWIVGAISTAVCFLVSNLTFRLRLIRSRKPTDMEALLPVYIVNWLDTPCMFGIFDAAIYINEAKSDRELCHVLCHESMHYRHGDNYWAVMRILCLIIHWYNPLVWMAALLSRRDSELACDEAVIAVLGEKERFEYGKTLIKMTAEGRNSVLNLATGMKGARKNMIERIRVLSARSKMSLYSLIAVFLAAAITVGCTFTGAETEQPKIEAEPIVLPEVNSAVPAAGKIYDRNRIEFDPEQYTGLAGSKAVFAPYIDAGQSIEMTIDADIQNMAEELLTNALNENGNNCAAALVAVDVNSGAPLAVVSKGDSENLALNGVYSPGDLFLPCTAVAAVDLGIVDLDYEIECGVIFDRYEQEGYAPQCWTAEKSVFHGAKNMKTALRDSCQFYFYWLGNDLGIDSLNQYTQAFGLGEDMGIELKSTAGFMPNRESRKAEGGQWRIDSTIETAVGRGGSAFSPLQFAEYCAVIANGGSRYSASLTQRILDAEGNALYTRLPELTAVGNNNAELWNDIRQAMYERSGADDPQFYPEGKMKMAGLSQGLTGIGDKLYMGFAPFEKPQIAFAVVFEDSLNNSSASNTAYDFVMEYQKIMENR